MKRLYRIMIKYEGIKETYEVYGNTKGNGFSNLVNYLTNNKGYKEYNIEYILASWIKDELEIKFSNPIN